MTRNLDLARRKDIDRPWNDYPIGTKALSCTGGYWTRIERGWKWATGSIFQTPGAEACAVILPENIQHEAGE